MKLATIFCRPMPMPTPTRAREYRQRRQVDPDRTERNRDRDDQQPHPDHLHQQNLDRRRQVGRLIDAVFGKIAGDVGEPERCDQEQAELDHDQRRQPQSAQNDRNRIQRIDRRIELVDDAQRRDQPRRQRYQFDQERVADNRGHKPDDQPGQREFGRDHQHVAAARPGRMEHRDARGNDQNRKHDGREACHQHMGEVPQRQRPSIGERVVIDARLKRSVGGECDSGRGQDQAELQVEPGRGDFRANGARHRSQVFDDVVQIHRQNLVSGRSLRSRL